MKIQTALSALLALGVLGAAPSFADTDVIDEETTPEEVMEQIALPEDASETALEASAQGLETANEARRDGRAFGQSQAERAREDGRAMGAQRAEAARERAEAAREQAQPRGRPDNIPRPE